MNSTSAGPGYEIVARQDFSDVTYLLEVRHPMLAKAARPASSSSSCRTSTASASRSPSPTSTATGTITLVIQAVGKTTREMQRDCRVGTALFALVGPDGHAEPHRHGAKKVLCVGGGLGVAPVFPQARAFKASGAYVIGVIGFRNKDLVFWEDKFRACCDELIVCTDDGSAGIKGLVTEGIEQALEQHPDIEECVAIGPLVMMKACAEATRPHKIKTMVSLNPIMVDGTGMCGGCRVTVGEVVKFACVDGPDFDGHLVDFDDLMFRLQRFTEADGARARSERFRRETAGCATMPTRRAEALPERMTRDRERRARKRRSA